jgi:hypothetical protein
MRAKLTALIVAFACLAAGAVAHAAPIPVAVYQFQSRDDVTAFQNVFGASCKRKWVANQALGILVGANTNACIFRSSVVGDSSDAKPDQGMMAATSVTGGNKKLANKAFVGVGVRESDSAGYVLRILPNAGKWQYLRDPAGPAGPKLEASGQAGKLIKPGGKPNTIAIRAFSHGGNTTSVIASVNGRSLVNTTDAGSDQPDGRRTVVTAGAKGSGAATGIMGIFDNVTVQVPNPF